MDVETRKHIAVCAAAAAAMNRVYSICKALSSFAYVHAFCVVNNRKAYTCGIGTRYFGAHRWNFFGSLLFSVFSLSTLVSIRFVSFRLLGRMRTCACTSSTIRVSTKMCWQSSAANKQEMAIEWAALPLNVSEWNGHISNRTSPSGCLHCCCHLISIVSLEISAHHTKQHQHQQQQKA